MWTMRVWTPPARNRWPGMFRDTMSRPAWNQSVAFAA
jgi:hypothetical protein